MCHVPSGRGLSWLSTTSKPMYLLASFVFLLFPQLILPLIYISMLGYSLYAFCMLNVLVIFPHYMSMVSFWYGILLLCIFLKTSSLPTWSVCGILNILMLSQVSSSSVMKMFNIPCHIAELILNSKWAHFFVSNEIISEF